MGFETVPACGTCGGRVRFGALGLISGRGRCEYCGTEVVRIVGSEEATKWCQKIYGYKQIGNLEKAREEAVGFAREYPGDFRAWLIDYELNAEHAVGPEYNPRPTAVANMSKTASDGADVQYLAEVGERLRSDADAIEARIAKLDGEIREAEALRNTFSKEKWRDSANADIDRLNGEIAKSESLVSSLGNYSRVAYVDFAKTFATIGGILLGLAMVADGCSKGDPYSAYNGVVLGPLGGLLFGAPAGAVIGLIVAGVVNLFRQRAADEAVQSERNRLARLKQDLQEKRAELGLAMDAGVIEDELGHLLWALGQVENCCECIDKACV